MVEWNEIFRVFRFSGILGQPREAHPKFRNEIPENDCSIRSTTRNFRNFWSNGKRPRLSESEAERKNQPIAKSGIEQCHWFILPLLLATRTMQFSLDRKQRRHRQNQCSASDSVDLIFTRSYRSTLLITTPTTTPSLVKTSL